MWMPYSPPNSPRSRALDWDVAQASHDRLDTRPSTPIAGSSDLFSSSTSLPSSEATWSIPSTPFPSLAFGSSLSGSDSRAALFMSRTASPIFGLLGTQLDPNILISPAALPVADTNRIGYVPSNVDHYTWERKGGQGKWHVLCPSCGKWVGTNGSHQRPNNVSSLLSHMRGAKCKRSSAQSVLENMELTSAKRARDLAFKPPSPPAPQSPPPRPRSAPPTSPSKGIAAAASFRFAVDTPSKYRHRKYTYVDNSSSDSEHDTDSVTLSPLLPMRSVSVGPLPTFDIFRDPQSMTHDTPRPLPSSRPVPAPHSPLPSLSNPFATCGASATRTSCPGIELEWPVGDVWSTYPWQHHGLKSSDLGYQFWAIEESIDGSGIVFRIRADTCEGSGDGSPCPSCRGVTKTVNHLADLSLYAAPRTNHKYLTHAQLTRLLEERDETVNTWKLKALNLARKVANLVRKLDDHRRFLMAVSTSDIPRLQQLVRQGIKANASVSSIVGKIESAMVGVYHARGYTGTDLDIALMVLRLGGRKLLYAMNHYISIPSIRALRRAHVFVKLMPSVGLPTTGEIVFNITSLFHPKFKEPMAGERPFHSGMSILWDEVNEENAACYIEHIDSVGGLCREHSSHVNLRLATFENAVSLGAALADGTVHYGKEVSVIAMASYGLVLRSAYPVMISPTCKQETPEESAVLLQKVLNAWKQAGEAKFGPVWSFASDGDAGRRAMVYSMFLKHEVGYDHPLYRYVSRLPGLNLLVGDDDVTGTFDWKHEIKRWARLLRTVEGVVIHRTVINHEMLRRHLLRTGSSTTYVDKLLSPGDSQDVPRAIDLINALHLISLSPTTNCTPFEYQEYTYIAILSDLVTSFMHAFLMPHWSLSDQVASLSKYAHMAFALFRENRINFMPYQLYGDTQTTVKDIIFTIAKQQEMDGSQPFYLFLAGDDRLEVLFGVLRMLGGHNPNFTFTQILDRIAAAMELEGVMARHPDLDQGHRRLKVTRTEKLDHLNPESWIGCVTAKSVDLPLTWRKGRDNAALSLGCIGLHPDFNALFDEARVLDMLKPFGDGKFPGVSTAPDLSQETIGESVSGTAVTDDDALFVIEQHDNLDPLESTMPDASIAGPTSSLRTATHANASRLPSVEDLRSSNNAATDAATEFLEAGSDMLEETLEPHDDHKLPSMLKPDERTPWLERGDGGGDHNRMHKATACREIITPYFIRKSHDRVWRVRGYTMDIKPRVYISIPVFVRKCLDGLWRDLM
ncbi:hypothetical protein BV25DRAFT_1874832 [Artomyces pyxidatus]|uniref:Uncharacterized protein n=1 Tax=Artomyces pyxidatus TaxID=48021 RepID=A0ACB8TL86_9AGAM|nr:hypothetical protein BV25DRAFT_1874832 [Artomyces pyxidatus]